MASEKAHGGHDAAQGHGGAAHGKAAYGRFLLMLLLSAIGMYAVSYLNSYSIDHVFFSWTRVFMVMMSVSVMALIMWALMRRMYTDRRWNSAIIVGAFVLFAAGLGLVRTQATIGDVDWMRAMIPHHSIAVLTSSEANLKDPRVRELARSIVDSQTREIDQMKGLIAELERQ